MDAKRTFLARSIAAGLECGTITPDDVLTHATAEVLANHLPKDQSAKLLAASLASKTMTPALVVETLGVATLAEHLPMKVLWGCIAACAQRALGGAAAVAVKPVADTRAKGAAGKAEPAKDDKAPAAKPNVSKSSPAPAASASSNARAGAAYPRATSSPPLKRRVPQTDFEVDTDVGEHWPANPVAEAEALGAIPVVEDSMTDWHQEQTRDVDISNGRKR